MTAGPSGSSVTSPRTISNAEYRASALPTAAENFSLSTASALPEGTLHSLAMRSSTHPIASSSALRVPDAVSSASDFSELEHTSSASPSVECAPVIRTGRISYIFTPNPRPSSCNAASQPASPPPTTVTVGFICPLRPAAPPRGVRTPCSCRRKSASPPCRKRASRLRSRDRAWARADPST